MQVDFVVEVLWVVDTPLDQELNPVRSGRKGANTFIHPSGQRNEMKSSFDEPQDFSRILRLQILPLESAQRDEANLAHNPLGQIQQHRRIIFLLGWSDVYVHEM